MPRWLRESICAQMAARVNAMRERWWLPFRPVDLALIIEKFTQNPRQALFAALHKVGDTYEHRADCLTGCLCWIQCAVLVRRR